MSREGGARGRIALGRGTVPTGTGEAIHALELDGQRVLLGEGDHVIGRAHDCDIVLESELVSRRHARLSVSGSTVFVEDLGSINGVTVDGIRVQSKAIVPPGSRLGLADAELTLERRGPSDARVTRRGPLQADASPKSGGSGEYPAAPIDRRSRAFELLSGVVNKALALGQTDEAERVLSGLLAEVLSEAEHHGGLPESVVDSAVREALRLSAATRKSKWTEYPIRLHLALGRALPLPVVDRLYALARQSPGMDLGLLHRYSDALETKRLAPTERFVLQRLRTLERMLQA